MRPRYHAQWRVAGQRPSDSRRCKIRVNFRKYNLEKSGDFQVVTCRSGEQGLKEIDEGRADLVLLDLMLHGSVGLESELGRGSRFTLVFPEELRAPERAAAASFSEA